ncbi:MAG: hypothetical protein KGM43_04980 [Planctomycetota bacterium]|nr:hypothetical protein [Planctomycetota bacterium]
MFNIVAASRRVAHGFTVPLFTSAIAAAVGITMTAPVDNPNAVPPATVYPVLQSNGKIAVTGCCTWSMNDALAGKNPKGAFVDLKRPNGTQTNSALSTLSDITIPTGSTNGNDDCDVQITLIPVTNPQTNRMLYGSYSVTATAIRKGNLPIMVNGYPVNTITNITLQ